MAVELSLELAGPSGPGRDVRSSLDMWAQTASMADQPCVVIDEDGEIVAVSPGCGELFGINTDETVGRLLTGVLDLRDFSTYYKVLSELEIKKTPPLVAISSAGLARGLLRVWVGDAARTVDSVSVPLMDSGAIVGSLTFFAAVNQ